MVLPVTVQNLFACLCVRACLKLWADCCMLMYIHCWELMKTLGSHGSPSLPFMTKVMVGHFVSDTHKVMTALIRVLLPSSIVVESLQSHKMWLCEQGHIVGFIEAYCCRKEARIEGDCNISHTWWAEIFRIFLQLPCCNSSRQALSCSTAVQRGLACKLSGFFSADSTR